MLPISRSRGDLLAAARGRAGAFGIGMRKGSGAGTPRADSNCCSPKAEAADTLGTCRMLSAGAAVDAEGMHARRPAPVTVPATSGRDRARTGRTRAESVGIESSFPSACEVTRAGSRTREHRAGARAPAQGRRSARRSRLSGRRGPPLAAPEGRWRFGWSLPAQLHRGPCEVAARIHDQWPSRPSSVRERPPSGAPGYERFAEVLLGSAAPSPRSLVGAGESGSNSLSRCFAPGPLHLLRVMP
jgi:hypothetical protein